MQVKDVVKCSLLSTCYAQGTGDCSTSIVILILSGPHEGPRTKNGCHGKTSDGWRLWVFVLMDTVKYDEVELAYELFDKMFQRTSSFEDIL